jgi:hypothetical protein
MGWVGTYSVRRVYSRRWQYPQARPETSGAARVAHAPDPFAANRPAAARRPSRMSS